MNAKKGLDNCHKNADCLNTKDGFECKCESDYMGDGIDLYDADQCIIGNHDCGKNAQCVDIDGEYNYECVASYIGDGINCPDVK